MLSAWKHPGFNVFCGNRISPNDDTAVENLARYIIRASFSQERMQYLDQEGKVIYKAKACPGPRSGDRKTNKVFPAREGLASTRDLQVMCSHIPNQGEQMVRYYGYYSNVSRKKKRGGNRQCHSLHSRTAGKFKGLPKELGTVDSENIRGGSPGLSEMQGDHADQQQYRRRVGDQGYTRTSGTLADQIKTAAENS